MTDSVRKKIKRGTIIMYGTVLLAAVQSVSLELITTDYAHEIFSAYFLLETSILVLMVVLGLENRWMRVFLVILTTCEMVMFLQDGPISPDGLLMMVIFGLRVYVIAGLFSKTINGHYMTDNRTGQR